MDKWEMYMEIRQLKKQGFKIAEIARKLGISRTTVYEYVNRTPEEMSIWVASSKIRQKKLDAYKDLILSWLKEHPDLSAAQVHDWILERYENIEIGESTTRAYVRELRKEYHIPKEANHRMYEAIPDPPMGQQAQVDFGQTTQKTSQGKERKLYFISFVLSHSRYKYAEWLDRPFTTRDVISAHENAFAFFEGSPHQLVYDQDGLLIVSENAGDLILTAEFQAYREERNLRLHVCRKADPESKGRIENVVGFIKKNFAKNRVFHNLESWNEQCEAWLGRTGNGRVHNTTKKRPVEVFQKEKTHLRPVPQKINIHLVNPSITRTVRKDNTILFHSNRYSLPLGTYKKDKIVWVEVKEDGQLRIKETQDGPVVAEHIIHSGKGKLIQDRQHTRDRSKGIDAYTDHIAGQFEDTSLAFSFLKEIRQRYPRYIRDQLQMVAKTVKGMDETTVTKALQECMKRKLFSAVEFSDVVWHIDRQRQVNTPLLTRQLKEIQPLYPEDQSIVGAKPDTRDVKEYLSILKGEFV